MGCKLYVGNLSWNAGEGDLTAHFEKYGTVEEAKVIYDRDTGRSKGFAFVKLSSDEEAELAIKQLNGTEFMGRNIKVSVAEDKPRNNRGGRDQGGYRGNGYRDQRGY